jgi:thiamine pyrophosphate-dependent acetolactate synthase large subunit-like protein
MHASGGTSNSDLSGQSSTRRSTAQRSVVLVVGCEPAQTDIPRVAFVMLARGLGADGVLVNDEAAIDGALAAAMRSP